MKELEELTTEKLNKAREVFDNMPEQRGGWLMGREQHKTFLVYSHWLDTLSKEEGDFLSEIYNREDLCKFTQWLYRVADFVAGRKKPEMNYTEEEKEEIYDKLIDGIKPVDELTLPDGSKETLENILKNIGELI